MHTVFVIPGFTHTGKEAAYKKVAVLLRKKGYTPIIFHPTWKRKTVTDVAVEFLNTYKKKLAEEHISLLGFSFGAIAALLIAEKIQPSSLFLCSVSPYLDEDTIPEQWKKIVGKRRIDDFASLSCKHICARIAARTYILVGEKEAAAFPTVLTRAARINKQIKNSHLTIVQNTIHDIGQKEYLEAINALI